MGLSSTANEWTIPIQGSSDAIKKSGLKKIKWERYMKINEILADEKVSDLRPTTVIGIDIGH